MKNRWRSLALPLLAVALMAGCVYVPPYPYYFEDPYSPSPWYHPPEPMYEPGDPYLRYRPDSRYYQRRYPTRRDSWGRTPADEPLDDRNGPDDMRPDVIPPARVDDPGSSKGSGAPLDPKDIPTATKGSKPGRVKLPFPPYNELDVSGMPSGSLAKDPSTGKVFRLP
jgi:hypothetical protein